MVECMERDGDLNKPAEGPQGRLMQKKNWADLAKVLNMDLIGEAKSVKKWKKVWSDLKNNTKKKAGKIHRAASGTGGGPASKLALSDLELRILAISGSQTATGLTNIEEVGAPPVRPIPAPLLSPTPPTEPSPVLNMLHVETSPSMSPHPAHTLPPLAHTPLTPAHTSPPTQTMPPSASRRRNFRPRSASRRSVPRTPRVDAATRQFQVHERWRNLVCELATQHLQLRRADQQLRREQLQVQAQWQALFGRFINLAENFLINLGYL